jgi:hypothetical protein
MAIHLFRARLPHRLGPGAVGGGEIAPQPLDFVSLPPQPIGTFRQKLPQPSVFRAAVFRMPGPIVAHA